MDQLIISIQSALPSNSDRTIVAEAFKRAKGNWSDARANLIRRLSPAKLRRLDLAADIVRLSDSDPNLVKAIANDKFVHSMRDVALNYDAKRLAAVMGPGKTDADSKPKTQRVREAQAGALHDRLFHTETSAVLQRMVQNKETGISDAAVRAGVVSVLKSQPDFNIRKDSIHKALAHPDALKGVSKAKRPAVVEHLKTLQRVQALSPTAAAVPKLLKSKLTSAFHISEMGESSFMAAHAKSLGEQVAKQVYSNAVNARLSNEQTLMMMHDSVRGTGIGLLDGKTTPDERRANTQEILVKRGAPLDLSQLFGGTDYCECDECSSVYSPASYLVELLNYLRNNNLSPQGGGAPVVNGYAGTPLEQLFRRRPDLGCIELTCANANTVLPYVDLATEVMESFVVHLGAYQTDVHDPKQATIDAFNVLDEPSAELVAQPQHINYQAYCILKNARYPFSLPYHQPIDATRILLNYMGTSRTELLRRFRTDLEDTTGLVTTAAQTQQLHQLHHEVQQRAVDAETLGMVQEDYIVLTREAFWQKAYFELRLSQSLSDAAYQGKIGVLPTWQYYGYASKAAMLDTNPNKASGLTFAKRFLTGTGIQYIDLVQLLQTQSINPLYPQGRALTVMDSLLMSYRAMQQLLVQSSNPSVRLAPLIAFLQAHQSQLQKLNAMLHPDPCHQHLMSRADTISKQELKQWVECWFERVGKLIVIESGDGPELSVSGNLYGVRDSDRARLSANAVSKPIAVLRSDGTIVNSRGRQIGHVQIDDAVVAESGKSLLAFLGQTKLVLVDPATGQQIGSITGRGLISLSRETAPPWLPAQDSCDLSKARIVHLDGTPVTVDEYDRMQRFIHLWRRLGWTIDEVDKAVVGYASPSANGPLMTDTSAVAANANAPVVPPPMQSGIDFDGFNDDCSAGPTTVVATGSKSRQAICPAPAVANFSITTAFLHELVAIKQLQVETGQPLVALLSFWADISTAGNQSLYATLFLKYNVNALDPIFKSDVNGNFLSSPAKITEHVPALIAALQIRADDVTILMTLRQMPDVLNLHSLSVLYRHTLLARVLGIKVAELPRVLAVLGEPFTDAVATLRFYKAWVRLTSAGFTYRQLDFVINGYNDPKQPLAPSFIKTLQLSKTLHDGLRQIDLDQPDPDSNKPEAATDDLVRTNTSLLYGADTVQAILALLDGTTLYSTNAPVLGAMPDIPADLAPKLRYVLITPPAPAARTATIQVTGILTNAEQLKASIIPNTTAAWAPAIQRIVDQAQAGSIFDEALAGVFTAAAKAVLLAGDVIVLAAQIDPASPDPNTAPGKRLYFLQVFMPFLRQRLARQLIIDTLSSAVNLDGDATDALLSNILLSGLPPDAAMDALLALKDPSAPPPGMWSGYLIAPDNDDYSFAVTSNAPPTWLPPPAAPVANATRLDGIPLNFPNPQADPNNIWWSAAVTLKRGHVYPLIIDASLLPTLTWKRPASAAALVPPTYLLADDSTQAAADVFVSMQKAAIIATGFSLTAAELLYMQSHSTDFSALDFNKFTLPHFERLDAYIELRNALPQTSMQLIDLFKWCLPANVSALLPPANATALLPQQIATATGWTAGRVTQLIEDEHLNLNDPSFFVNEIALRRMQKALAISNKTNMDIDRLFEWADASSQFWPCHTVAESIRNALQAQFIPTDWEQVVKPLNDQLRANQQAALVAYLLAQQPLIDWGAVDADSLFEFFLIDVQMCTCMQTSRIKQAIASVQQYVQRCILGLEEPYVRTEVLDRGRWLWMQKYRLWEANRKVYLYPENWLVPSLRDDKSSFYKDLESELLQKDIDSDLIEGALRRYLYSVDEVANMEVVGIHVGEDSHSQVALHVFARTRNTPNILYYRSYSAVSGDWMPWEKMQVDIPTLEKVDSDSNTVLLTGVYLVPVVWNNRLLVFFPDFQKKSVPNAQNKSKKFSDMNDSKVGDSSQSDYWEIKLAWTERRDDQWTQKQISTDRAVHYLYALVYPTNLPAVDVLSSDIPIKFSDPLPPPKKASSNTKWYTSSAPDVSRYVFIPRITPATGSSVPDLDIDIYYVDQGGTYPGVARFIFGGNELHLDPVDPPAPLPPGGAGGCLFQEFHSATAATTYSFQALATGNPPLIGKIPNFETGFSTVTLTLGAGSQDFTYPFTHALLRAVNTEDLDGLYDTFATITSGSPQIMDQAFGATGTGPSVSYSELKRPYSLYNWEFGLHSLMAMIEKMVSAQQFDAALSLFHYIFDPGSQGTALQRCWIFPPFKKISASASLEQRFLALQAGVPDTDITNWRNDPYEPYLVARGRPVAFMKWVAMKYIQLLVDYGDYYFRQNTLEAIPMALQCYALASHIFGPKPQVIPKRGKIEPETYQSLLNKWDAFGNALVELELAFPFSNQTTSLIVKDNGLVGLPNIFGFASSLYFGIPPNADLLALRALIDDRLFKIRHCEDINGVVRSLPLFEPEIDPLLLVEAEAQGLDLNSVLNDLSSPTPNYRFNYLLQKSYAYVSELKALGNAYLSSNEKGDAEGLAKLRASHETNLYTLTLEVRNQQLAEANAALDALEQSRKGPVNRLQHFLALIGADLSQVPTDDSDFAEIADPIEAPTESSGLILSSYEKEEMLAAEAAALAHDAVGRMESVAGILSLIPEFGVNVQLFGIGPTVDFGGRELAAFTQATARMLQVVADEFSFESSNAARKGGYLRQLQDRVLQANSAGLEIKSIDKQILTQEIRIDIATKEIANTQSQMDNAQAVEDFLRNKYTNQDLYTWMQTSLRTLCYQTYQLTFDMASRTQAVFRFERPLSPAFITQGYWDDSRDGLLAGEQLETALKRMELAYVADRPYDFEVLRPLFSLREIDPLALVELRASGSCEFNLSEALYDRDFAGDFMRRIKTIALEVPWVAGPGVSLSCKLELVKHRYRTTANLTGGYAESQDEPDERFATVNVPINAIAASTGQNDHGVFEVQFNGERYLPFEGAGAISTWRLELPPDIRSFDYETITDVGIRVFYSSSDGGALFKSTARTHLAKYLAGGAEPLGPRDGPFAAFELSRDFADEWYKAVQAGVAGKTTFSIQSLGQRLPYYAQFLSGVTRAANKIQATDIYFVYETSAGAAYGQSTFGGNPLNAADSPFSTSVQSLTVMSLPSVTVSSDQWDFSFDYTASLSPISARRAWLVIKYTLN